MTTNTLLILIILNEQFFSIFVDMAKNKLTNLLLIYNEKTSSRVNLDILNLQFIRETKCMLRMNHIPKSAKIILLQEDNEVSFMVKEYVRILKRINKIVSENYFKGHIKDFNN